MFEICEEMKKLRNLLDEKNIKWTDATEEMSDLVKIARTHFEYKGYKVSVVNGFGTYGGWSGANIGADEEKDNLGLLECYIPYAGDLCGWLTAEEVMKFIESKLGYKTQTCE